ncbi:MAG: ABC transporter permease [Clostridiales bacterium]|jgi:ABC-2 type transport system permease protein|nr:ABC transporter permease [Eubacteriales bacterium]MDH7566443.1 ABC transporter permease [Clostridiales bacterium]
MHAIFKREVKAYFYSPIAYVLTGLFIFISSIFFLQNLFGQIGTFNDNLSSMALVLLFIIPILTMRALAEERKNGTEVLLVTSPVSVWGIVMGKFLAALFMLLVMVVITFIYPLILVAFGGALTVQLVGGYIGFILMGASCIAVGIFASSLTENQVVAAVIGFISLLTMWLIDFIANFSGGLFAQILQWFSIISRYNDFSRGILSLSPVVYYLSFIGVFLFLTVRVIEKRRWSQG